MSVPLLPLMAYAIVVSVLLGVAAWGGERLLALWKLPVRWVWVAAMAASLLLPLAWAVGWRSAPDIPAGPWTAALDPPEVIGLANGPAGSEGAEFSSGARASFGVALPELPAGDASTILTLWASLSVLGAVVLTLALMRLGRLRASWPRKRVEGTQVRVSPDHGPAVVGVLRPEVLLPAWILGAERHLIRLVLRHEEGHIEARDTRLLAGGVGAVLLMPWNPGVWWQFARLRAAVEVDCDRRVLRGGADPADYARALIEIGGRRLASASYPAILFHPGRTLERRLKMMIDGGLTRRLISAVAGVGLGAAALLVACDSEPPVRPVAEPAAEATGPEAPVGMDALREALDGVRETAERVAGADWDPADWEAYRTVLEGRFEEYVRAREAYRAGTGDDPGEFRIEDVSADGEAVPTEGVRVPAEIAEAIFEKQVPSRSAVTPRVANGPVFTPFDHEPELANRPELERALMREYPPVLRDAGIGGSVELHFHISETGEVLETVLASTSGHTQLDEAAQRVAAEMRFTAARNLGSPVPVWVKLTLRFQ